ncbi:Short-chain dehydrogenase TIC 32 chloroplastic [Bienertia sinuspersici]
MTSMISGETSGIGVEATQILAMCGVHVMMVVRNVDASKNRKAKILEEIPAAKLDIMELDLSSLASVMKFASEYKSLGLPLNVLIVSSEAHRFAYSEGIRFGSINDESSYNRLQAHGQSKLANILHACKAIKGFIHTLRKLVLKDVSQGAATSCYVALRLQVEGLSGEYFMDSNIAEPTSQAKDAELAKKLWDFSLKLGQV